MKPKFLLIAAAAFLAAIVSCTDNMDVYYNVPYISMDQIKEQKGGVFEFWGECSAEDGIPGCEYFFLCSSSETDFSKADRIEAIYSKTEGYCDYRALYEPSAGGTFYVKFCADNNGLSYIESNVMNFEYKPVDYTSPVDLGLPSGVKWAQTNLGAKTPDEYGNYYAWGETVTKDIYSWDYYRHSAGSGDMLTKYCNKDGWGNKNFRDNITALELADDAARANLKDKWRIPSDYEFAELMEYCKWAWAKSENGVYGYEFTSVKNGNSIFLPASGLHRDNEFRDNGMGLYWSNSLSKNPDRAGGIFFDKGQISLSSTDDFHIRSFGLSVRPVYGDYVAAEKVMVYPESSTVELGGKVQMEAYVSPSNATNKGVTWVSVDTKVATVSESGLVTGVSGGTAYIDAIASDGKTFARCTVKVESDMVAVDLGLPSGVKWASCNVGATKPEEYGDYYAWGETGTKTVYDWSTYKWCEGAYEKMIKYNTVAAYGKVDNRLMLEPEDDVAYTLFGDKWRMPSAAEIVELMANCTREDCRVGGVYGCKFTSNIPGYSDKWIFIPAAGYRGPAGTEFDGVYCDIWSSSYVTYYPKYAYGAHLQDHIVDIDNRYWGYPVRAVYGDRIPVSGVRMDNDTIILNVGETFPQKAIITPSNATEKGLVWSTSDESVVTVVEYSGVVTAVKEGTATITVKTVDGGYSATCKVTVKGSINGHEYVDLGLSVKWATCNVGATNPEDYGGYYQWGGKKDVTSTSIILGWKDCPFMSLTGWTKYNTKSSDGTVDNKTVLDLSDDVAHVNWGGSWRMPTDAEWKELIDNCIWTWTIRNGVDGYRVARPSYTRESIFLPAAGFRSFENLLQVGSDVSYWSSSLNTGDPDYAEYLTELAGVIILASGARYNGHQVRAVSE